MKTREIKELTTAEIQDRLVAENGEYVLTNFLIKTPHFTCR